MRRLVLAIAFSACALFSARDASAQYRNYGYGGHHHHSGPRYGGLYSYGGGYGVGGGLQIQTFGLGYGYGYGGGLNVYGVTPGIYGSAQGGYDWFGRPLPSAYDYYYGAPAAVPAYPPPNQFGGVGLAPPPGQGAPNEPLVRPSNAETRTKALRLVAQGDEWFMKQNYLQAYSRYKQAAAMAPDLAQPRFHLGYALVALGYQGQAGTEFKRGLKLDPTWPVTGIRLEQIYGEQNVIAKDAMLQRTANWVREDIRDPERLFVMGVLLHFNNDTDKALTIFQTADALAGSPPHIVAFLRPVNAVAPNGFAVNNGQAQPILPAQAMQSGAQEAPGPAVIEQVLPQNVLPPNVAPRPPAAPSGTPAPASPSAPAGGFGAGGDVLPTVTGVNPATETAPAAPPAGRDEGPVLVPPGGSGGKS